MNDKSETREPGRLQANKKSRRAGVESPSEDRFAKGYDFLIANGVVDESLYSGIVLCTSKNMKNEGVILSLITYGGEANHAYRIARHLQAIYKDVVVFVPSLCKSAGTLIATAANSLILMPYGEIGPLDVQLLQKDEIFGRRSGLAPQSALDHLKRHSFELFESFVLGVIQRSGGAVSFRLAAEIAAKATSKVMSSLYGQINPEVLGQDLRDLDVATEYAKRLNCKFENLRPEGIKRLVHDYPSHDFVIDYLEARDLFERVDAPTKTIWDFWRKNLDVLGTPRISSPFVDMKSSDTEAIVSEADGDDENQREERLDGLRQEFAANGVGAAPTP